MKFQTEKRLKMESSVISLKQLETWITEFRNKNFHPTTGLEIQVELLFKGLPNYIDDIINEAYYKGYDEGVASTEEKVNE